MNRRDTVFALLLSGVLFQPKLTPAQALRRIVILNPFQQSSEASELFLREFRSGLTKEALTDGRDYALDSVSVQIGNRLTESVHDAIGRHAALIVAITTPVAQAAAREARGLPVVFAIVTDPVVAGLVASLSRPGGNVTGVSHIPDVIGKLLEVSLEFVPGASQMAVLFNPDNEAKVLELHVLQSAAKARDVMLREFPVRSGEEIERALITAKRNHAQAMVILAESLVANHVQSIGEIALRMRLPVIASAPSLMMGGALASYSPDYPEQYRRLAALAAKILRGVKPSDIPVEQPTKLELVINSRTAKSLGLKIPQSLLVRAARVIE